MKKNIEKKIKKLIENINYHSDLYYNQNSPEISDAEFDRMYDEFLSYLEEYPEINNWEEIPTKKVGADSTSAFTKFKHKSPMLSIDQKGKNIDDLEKWFKKLNTDEVIIQPKFDGITVNINYEDGKFINAATRGNGVFGDLITEQFKETDTKYPETLKTKELELRGEAIIPYDFFKKNKMGERYSNMRNAAAGILHSKEASDVKNKGIKVVFYDIGLTTEKLTDADSENIENIIKNKDFDCTPYWVCKGWDELKRCIETRVYGNIKEVDGFNILKCDGYPEAMCDGIVIKSNSLRDREELGFSQKGPKWAFALKFPPLQAKTTLEDVIWNVGKSGRITPIAVFEEVSIGGTKIKKATLNNIGYMSKLPIYENGQINLEKTSELHESDDILIERSNDVIPRIVAIIKHNSEKIEKAPDKCPICGGKVIKENDLITCINDNCGAKTLSKIEHFASRDAMNIDGLGEGMINKLNDKGLLNSFADIYKLEENKDKIENMEGMGKKSVEALIKAINKSKDVELGNFLYSLAIPNIGKKMSNDLAKEYKTIDNFLSNWSYNQILKLDSFGEVYTNNLCDWLSKIENIKMIKDLLKLGIKPREVESMKIEDNKLNGACFVITGTLSQPRKYFEELIIKNGGKTSDSVSKNTNYLLAGEKAGSKLEKAEKLGVKIINENEFKKMIG